MIEPDKWAIVTDAEGRRVARGLWAFTPTGRLRSRIFDVWLKPDEVRIDVFENREVFNEYAWFVITWTAADMRRVLHERSYTRATPLEIAYLATDLAKGSLFGSVAGYRGGGYQMPLFNIRDGGETWHPDELYGYIKAW
jgi:hypothetical protein